MRFNPSVVLVTGAAGFIGSHLVDALLAKGHKVIGVDNLSVGTVENIEHNFSNNNFVFHKLDITNLDKLKEVSKKINVVFHLAALKIPKYGGAKETLLNNTKGTENVLEIARENKAKFIFNSSSDVYGKNPNLPLREELDLVLGPSDVKRWSYATSKIYDEQLIFAYYAAHKLPVVILRIFNSYGPRNNLSWKGGPQSIFIEAIFKNEPIIVHGDGLQTRCFTYISDTIKGILRGMEKEQAIGNIFNIGSDKTEISIINLAYLIKDLSKTKEKLKINFVEHNKLFGKYEEISRRIPDITKAKKILGFEPEIGLKEGLSKTIEWQKDKIDYNYPV